VFPHVTWAELRQQLGYELSGIEGVPEILLDALDQQDVGALESHPLSATQLAEIQWCWRGLGSGLLLHHGRDGN
jgi:hypothetical protein